MKSDADFTTCEVSCLTDGAAASLFLLVFLPMVMKLCTAEMGISLLPATVPGCSMPRSWLHCLFMKKKNVYFVFFKLFLFPSKGSFIKPFPSF